MRSNIVKSLVLGLALLGLTAGTRIARAQAPITLIEYTNMWRYFTNGTDLDVAWRATNFNDSAWQQGRGILGVETTPDIYTRAAFNTVFAPYVQPIITYYFRTTFNLPTGPCGVTLVSSNYIDDGAVIYLNGVEMHRFRVPVDQIFSTLASAQQAAEGQNDIASFTPPVGVLRQGTNVIAVEVHQVNATSSDIVWAMKLIATFSAVTPIAITNQPQSTTTPLLQPTTFCVGAGGQAPVYQWQRANNSGGFTNIPGATAFCYTINPTLTNHAGGYRAVVSNCSSSQTSSVATLTVIADFDPPGVISAIVDDPVVGPSTVRVLFDEKVAGPAVTSTNSYTITSIPPGSGLAVTNVAFDNVSTVLLRVRGTPSPATNYVLTVNNVRDASPNTNIISTNTLVPIAVWRDVLVSYETFWNWRQVTPEDGFPANPVANWMTAAFNETNPTNTDWVLAYPSFGLGLAPFTYSFDPLPFPENTQLQYNSNCYYFKTRFDLGTNVGSVGAVKFTHLIDDGAVFYLNGKEVYRYNMPPFPNPVDFYTVASSSIGIASSITAASPTGRGFSVTNLVAGTNILAVEVHQQADDLNAANTDVVFATDLRVALGPNVTRPSLTLVRNGSNITITWSAPGYVLQSASVVTGPWTNVASAVSPYTTAIGGANGARRYYRLVQ